MLLMTKSVLAMMIGFLLSVSLGLILIPLLRKWKIGQNVSRFLNDNHMSKNHTPTMGGFIFIIPTLITVIILIFMRKMDMTYSLAIVILSFVGYATIGFIDDYIIILLKNNKGLNEKTKLLFQLIIAIIFFYLFMKAGNEPLVWIHTLNIRINIGFLYGLFILFVLLATSNAVNITDGLDGLASGLSVIAFLAFGLISYNSGWLEGYEDIGLFCFILIGSLLGFLIFNSKPAKVFMGDTGSLALGATLGSIAILTRHELTLILVGIVFVVETLSTILQRLFYKFLNKRLFPMAPIHHSFEKKGWKENDIVKLFWIIGLLGTMIALTFGVWL